jgi:transcription elongation factor GreA
LPADLRFSVVWGGGVHAVASLPMVASNAKDGVRQPFRVRSCLIMSAERIPMTREGYDKLKAELDHLQNAKMIEITKRVAEARAMGDLSENAEYHAAREDQGQLQAKVDVLKNRLALAEIIDKNSISTDSVAFGATVRVKDLDLDEEETFVLVGPGEEDPSENRILTSSPIGKGLLGKNKGEIAEIEVPMGTVRFQVVEISFG